MIKVSEPMNPLQPKRFFLLICYFLHEVQSICYMLNICIRYFWFYRSWGIIIHTMTLCMYLNFKIVWVYDFKLVKILIRRYLSKYLILCTTLYSYRKRTISKGLCVGNKMLCHPNISINVLYKFINFYHAASSFKI